MALMPSCGLATGVVSNALSGNRSRNPAPIPPLVIASIDEGQLIANPDTRRGIPIPYRIIGQEGEVVQVLFQWTREGEDFPELPNSKEGLIALRSDPEGRRDHQIADEVVQIVVGVPSPFKGEDDDPDLEGRFLKLPELASSSAQVLATGIVGDELALLRRGGALKSLGLQGRLHRPVSALPLGRGLTAIVLDSDQGMWRLREIALATGEVVAAIASGLGTPTAMTKEAGGDSVLIATQTQDIWGVTRVFLDERSPMNGVLIDASDGNTELGEIRGIVSVGGDSCLITVGDSLIRLSFSTRSAYSLFGPGANGFPLGEPSGLALDPKFPFKVLYVAEKERNRIITVDLETLAIRELPTFGLSVDAPSALSFEGKNRLLVVTDDPSKEGLELRGVNLEGEDGDGDGDGFADSHVFEISCGLAKGVRSLGTGPDGLRILVLGDNEDLAVGGGVEQVRVIEEYFPEEQVVVVDRPWSPPIDSPKAAHQRRWRIERRSSQSLLASEAGVSQTFLWDSTAAIGGRVNFRIIPIGNEVGVEDRSSVSKVVTSPFDREPTIMEAPELRVVALASGDLDGDGDLDLVGAISGQNDGLVLYRQIAKGDFVADPNILRTGIDTPEAIALGDLDADTDIDIVCASSSNNSLTIFFQQTRGEFIFDPARSVIVDESAQAPSSVVAADMDGDGDLDLVSANAISGTLAVFEQRTPGDFVRKRIVRHSSIVNPQCVVVADVNSDGLLDLVSANAGREEDPETSSLTVFTREESGGFRLSQKLQGPSMLRPEGLEVADLDGDGRLDLASANVTSDNVTIFLQESSGQFVMNQSLEDRSILSPTSVVAADVDGDGRLELGTSNSTSDNLTLFRQESPGQFVGFELLSSTSLLSPQAVAFGDFDGDSDVDIVSVNRFSNNLTLFAQVSRDDFSFDPIPNLLRDRSIDGPASVVVADFDGDGDLDIASSNFFSDNITIFFQSSTGLFTFEPSRSLIEDEILEEPQSLQAVDLDLSGDLEIVVANEADDSVVIFGQSEPGKFLRQQVIRDPTMERPEAVTFADFDLDGDMDLISANSTSNNSCLFLQDESGQFKCSAILGNDQLTNRPTAIAAGDLDGDGDQDVVLASFGSNNLTVFSQSDSGEFELSQEVQELVDGPVAVAIADLNDDGRPDLVCGNFSSSRLTVYFQTEGHDFEFDPNHSILEDPNLVEPAAVRAADLDRDGDIDLVSANLGSNNLTIWLQTAPGRFTLDERKGVLELPSISDQQAVTSADIDGDGDIDIVSANLTSDNLTIFYGAH